MTIPSSRASLRRAARRGARASPAARPRRRRRPRRPAPHLSARAGPAARAAGTAPRRCPRLHRRVAWSDAARLAATTACARRGPRSLVGCRALRRDARSHARTWQRAVRRRRVGRRRATARGAPRSSSAVYARTGRVRRRTARRGLVTGYYEPLLRGQPHADRALSRCRSTRRPTTCSSSTSSSLHPELKDKRLRGARRGHARRAVLDARARSSASAAPLAGQGARVGRRSGRRVLPADPGIGPGRSSTTASVMRVGYADQNGHPYRSIGARADRARRAHARARVDAGDQGVGAAQPGQARSAARREPELRVLPRGAAAAPRDARRAIDGPLGSLGVPLLAERTIAVDPRVVPLGAPVFLATTWPLSPTPLERLMLAQDTGGAIRGAVRADFFWGFGDGPGREAGRMRQDGRCGCCGRAASRRRRHADRRIAPASRRRAGRRRACSMVRRPCRAAASTGESP